MPLPKPAELTWILETTLQADRYLAAVPAFQAVQETSAFWPVLSVLSSLAFAAAILAVAVRQLVTTDY